MKIQGYFGYFPYKPVTPKLLQTCYTYIITNLLPLNSKKQLYQNPNNTSIESRAHLPIEQAAVAQTRQPLDYYGY